ncbi:MAG: beta-ketoacyl synthase N-terminal-like domain-containing protein, partial [Pseudomonadota bacterium]
MIPLALTAITATSCIGRGLQQTLAALQTQRSGLAPCQFETVDIATCIGEVAGVDAVVLPEALRDFDCRNNRLAHLGLRQDDFATAVQTAVARWGRRRVGVFIGTSTSGILQTEIAYRHRDPQTGALPADFHYPGTQNLYSAADFVRRSAGVLGPAVVISCACSSSAKVFASAAR